MNEEDRFQFLIDGQPVGGIESVSFTSARDEDVPSACIVGSMSAEYTCTLPLQTVRALEQLLSPRRPGASDATLVRRVSYGGRKGRSALRRLLERAPPMQLSTGSGISLIGKAVFLNESES